MELKPLDRIQLDAAALMAEYPPHWGHPNKQAVFDAVLRAGQGFNGTITYARWPAAALPPGSGSKCQFVVRPGFFTYEESGIPGGLHWHVNFADPYLFVAYGSSLLAQDELQALEHPILGSLREALVSMGKAPKTVDSQGRPTPITIAGVQRHCAIDTLPNPRAGRPYGLYGNAFARASKTEVVAAAKLLTPPTVSHILAMAALACEWGPYSRDQIDYLAATAYTGFLAARLESERLGAAGCRAVVHTGFWGCGAFGGNRTLMTLLQAFAADWADVDMVFHASDEAGFSLAQEAMEQYDRLRETVSTSVGMVDALAGEGFQWGESDGN